MSFPLKTALALATCIVALAAVHRWNPGKGLAPSVVADAGSFPNLHPHRSSAAAVAAQPLPPQVIQTTKPTGSESAAPSSRSNFLFDNSGALDSFFAALTNLDAGRVDAGKLDAGSGGEHVTILHYGDSPTTADLITGDARALLQGRFGNGGHGYLLIAKPWAWYGHRDTDISSRGWTISNAVGKMRPDIYGIGGVSFNGSSGAGSHITLKGAPQTSMELSFLAQPDGGTVSITADDTAGDKMPVATISTGSETRQPAWRTIALPPGTKAVDIQPASGHVELFGETFKKQQRGILYDSLGLNGASTTVLSRGFNPEVWAAELRHDTPALIIINYGTNESSFGEFVDRQYEAELRTAIQRIRNALPNVSILVMSPMDRGERSGIDAIRTMATIPQIVTIQRRVAEDMRCAFFDTFNAMGGDGTMSRWYASKPRLVSADLIHPTPQGAFIIAQIFVRNLSEAYDSRKPRPAAPEPKQAAR